MDLFLEISTVFYSWIIFFLFGWSEAFYWHYFAQSKQRLAQRYEHSLWTALRFFIHIPIGLFYIDQFQWFTFLGVFGLIATSFFIHDGAYYYFRNRVDKSYPEKWKATSTSSTAKFTIEYHLRKGLFIWGSLLIAMMFLSKYDGI